MGAKQGRKGARAHQRSLEMPHALTALTQYQQRPAKPKHRPWARWDLKDLSGM